MPKKYILLERLYRRHWILDSELCSVGLAYEDYLRKHKYKKNTIHFYLASVAHFALWHTSMRLGLSAVNKELCERFINDHVPSCSCQSPRQLQVANIRAALNHLCAVLAELGYSTTSKTGVQPIVDDLAKFSQYMKQSRGLADHTCNQRLRIVGQFLLRHFGADRIDIDRIHIKDLDGFILFYSSKWSPGSLKVVRGAIRSYLRYRSLEGDKTEVLSAALPVLANWSENKLPKSLTDKQLKCLMNSFDFSKPVELRDYAIARCLVDLGLRGHEVAALRIESVNWREGTITITGSKARQSKSLPLPDQTGAAIVRYLKEARPAVSDRQLFVRHRAPWNKPITVLAIKNAMNRAFKRSGLDQFSGTHILRHTLATRLQKAGVSLKEIADVLRHKSLDTTTIYAKVDLVALKKVAQPWPGRQQ